MMRILRQAFVGMCLSVTVSASAAVAGPVRVDVPIRGRTLSLSVYQPDGQPRGTVIMGSGDVGWVGLAVTRAQELSADGYRVVGLNMREYLAAVTSGRAHLSPEDVQHDFGELSRALRSRGWLTTPVILSGVSEGAGIAIVAAAAPENHAWVNGVITMGLPEISELAWRWTDIGSWITKKDAAEPSVRATDYVGRLAPVPLAMIQSAKDEYVPESDYRAIERAAGHPKMLTLIQASNHRFTDRLPELRRAYAAALAWIADQPQSRVD